ncbi:HAD family hydrolase [Sorangium sp. So ce1128]
MTTYTSSVGASTAAGQADESMPDVVFFDAAGTLFRFAPSFAELFAERCGRSGLSITAADAAAAYQAAASVLHQRGESLLSGTPFTSAERARRFWARLYQDMLEHLGVSDDCLVTELLLSLSSPRSYELFTDVPQALARVRELGVRMGVISNFEPWLVDVLERLGIAGYFELLVISTREGVAKPDPEIYHRAVQRAGVLPSRTLHVGDSLAHDVIPAAAAGMRAVLLARRGPMATDYLAIASLTDLEPMLLASST